MSQFFSPDYATARARFIEVAKKRGAETHTLPLSVKGPDNATLSIDIAWLGSKNPKHAVIHFSGIHGVEAFAGSAIQLKALTELAMPSSNHALIFVHVLNPFGMAWLRRYNESNVDLNRNFMQDSHAWDSEPPTYKLIDSLINPRSTPRMDFFYTRFALYALRHGMSKVKSAIVRGQHQHPRGLFFGGKRIEEGPQLLISWLKEHLVQVAPDFIFCVDVHTGLGKFAAESLFAEPKSGALNHNELHTRMNSGIKIIPKHSHIPYVISGSLSSFLPTIFPKSKVHAIAQEFGTYPVLRMLHALREENRLHHYGDAKDLQHPAKSLLKKRFAPENKTWQQTVLQDGISLIKIANLTHYEGDWKIRL